MAQDPVDRILEQWRRERPDLDSSNLGLAARIDILAKLLRRAAARRLAGVGLKIWEYDVLAALRRQGTPYRMPVTELAKASLLTSGAMTTRVDQLEKKGLVCREPDPADRRSVLIRLTKAGRALVNEGFSARLAAASSSLDELTQTERRTIEHGLRKLLLSESLTSENT